MILTNFILWWNLIFLRSLFYFTSIMKSNIICIIPMSMLSNLTLLKIQFKIQQNSTRYGNLSFAQQNKFIWLIYQKKKVNEKWSALHSWWVHLSYCFESLKSFEYTLTYIIFTVYELLLFPFSVCQTVDDVCYLCEETIVVYILDDPPKGDSSSLLYSTVHYCDDSRTGSFWNVSLLFFTPSLARAAASSSCLAFYLKHNINII